MVWAQQYHLFGLGLLPSALIAAIPVFTVLFLLGVKRTAAWVAAVSGLGVTFLLAVTAYQMPVKAAVSAAAYGAAFGLFPICWIIFWAIALYRVTVDSGKFEIIKDSLGTLTTDARMQMLLIAFAFGAFMEGASGFGTPVAVAAAMLTGLGMSPFAASAVCLLANTAPVAFGSIGIPIVTLAGITGLPVNALAAFAGRICAPISLFIPAYLIAAMGGRRSLRAVLPAVVVCGVTFASAQFLVSNFLGPQLTDIISSLSTILALVILLRVWHPAEVEGHAGAVACKRHSLGAVLGAWMPYILLVIFVLLWGYKPVGAILNSVTFTIPWPALHNQIQRMPPVVLAPANYAAIYTVNWLSASGSACMFATLLSAALLGFTPVRFVKLLVAVAHQLIFPTLTTASVLALAFLMNYCGGTGTLGLAFAMTGVAFPFFSALLGWLGVFLTGSDTSANALFGSLQVVTATRLGLDPVLMAAANSVGGVMGKMISLQTIAVAAAATGLSVADQSKLFRFTLKHSLILASVTGLVVLFYAYVLKF